MSQSILLPLPSPGRLLDVAPRAAGNWSFGTHTQAGLSLVSPGRRWGGSNDAPRLSQVSGSKPSKLFS